MRVRARQLDCRVGQPTESQFRYRSVRRGQLVGWLVELALQLRMCSLRIHPHIGAGAYCTRPCISLGSYGSAPGGRKRNPTCVATKYDPALSPYRGCYPVVYTDQHVPTYVLFDLVGVDEVLF